MAELNFTLPQLMKAAFTSFVKTSRYLVYIDPPVGMKNSLDNNEFLCKGADFPFFTFESLNEFYNLKHNKAIYKIDYDPIELVFHLDSGLLPLEFILEWAKLIKRDDGSYGYPDEYHGTITISLLHGRFNKVLKTAKLINAFPVNINNLSLSYDDIDTLAEVGISWEYSDIKYI